MKKTLLALGLVVACGTAAAVDFPTPYFGVMAGTFYPDSNRPVERRAFSTGGINLVVGLPLTDFLNVEPNAWAYYLPRKDDRSADGTAGGGIDLMLHQGYQGFTPYLIVGGGAAYVDVAHVANTNPYIDAGGGFIQQFGSSAFSIRGEIKGFFEFGRTPSEFRDDQTNDIRASLGIQYGFFGEKPAAPLILDSDGDGVPDTIDQCPGTPPGTPVDATGCPAAPGDSDGDGVPDTIDQCPGTPPGTPVDATGCPVQAPMNPDEDGDGVPNELDKCPNTPAGFKVDATGCLIEQTMTLQTVNFEFDSDRLTSDAKGILDGIAAGLNAQTGVRVQISGHTDALGPQGYNLTLSQKRARSVVAYLESKGVAHGRMKADGQGEFAPIASNDTDAGRAKNRRVEFKIINQ